MEDGGVIDELDDGDELLITLCNSSNSYLLLR